MNKSEILLGRLIEERMTPGADVAEIDRRISTLFEEEWCVVFTGMAGAPSTPEHRGIIPFLCSVHEFKRLSRPVFESNGGLVVKVHSTGFLVIFRRPHDALEALVQLNRTLATYNASRPQTEHLHVGAGMGFGRVLKIGDQDVYGSEVLQAYRLGDDVAQPGDILLTDATRAALVHTPGVEFLPMDAKSRVPVFRAVWS